MNDEFMFFCNFSYRVFLATCAARQQRDTAWGWIFALIYSLGAGWAALDSLRYAVAIATA